MSKTSSVATVPWDRNIVTRNRNPNLTLVGVQSKFYVWSIIWEQDFFRSWNDMASERSNLQ